MKLHTTWRWRPVAAAAVAALVAGCGQDPAGGNTQRQEPVAVDVVTVQPQALTLHSELPGRIEPVRVAEVWSRRPADALLALMMLCHGTRISETRLAKWSNVDLAEGGEWFIPAEDAKTKADHRLPITRQVRQLLTAYRARQVAAGYSGAYLFPRGDGHPLSEKQGQQVFERLTGGEWTSHDLRKIARSLWADLGVDYLIGELLLNHALDDLDTAYIHTHAKALKRDALERWHCWLEARGLSFFATETEPGRAAPATAPQASTGAASAAV